MAPFAKIALAFEAAACVLSIASIRCGSCGEKLLSAM